MKRKTWWFGIVVFCAGFVAVSAANVPTAYRVDVQKFKMSTPGGGHSVQYDGNVDVSIPATEKCHLWLYGFSRKGARVYVRGIARETISVSRRKWYYVGECDSGNVLPISLGVYGGYIERLGLAITTTKEAPKNIGKAPELKVTR
ncbi:MAG: hypothetical protein MJ033_01875 [Victivallaceae bacterium]|nr:hypothetical protein [Victivallaceae bacterium]